MRLKAIYDYYIPSPFLKAFLECDDLVLYFMIKSSIAATGFYIVV